MPRSWMPSAARGDRARRVWDLISVGARIDAASVTELVAATVMTNVAMALRALWLKLVVDAVVAGDVTAGTAWGLVLAVSDALRSVALVRMELSKMDLQDRGVEHFQTEAMRLAGGPPGIAHYEDQATLDRLDQLRLTLPQLSAALASVVDGLAVVARAGFVLVLLAFVHPALVLLPLFAVPSLLAGRRGEHQLARMQLATSAPNRRAEHLYGLLTQPARLKELRVGGLEAELRGRDRALWHRVGEQERRGTWQAARTNLWGWSVFALGYVGAMALVASQALAGRASAGDLLLTVILAGLVNETVQQAAGLVAVMTRASQAVDLYRSLEQLTTPPQPPPFCDRKVVLQRHPPPDPTLPPCVAASPLCSWVAVTERDSLSHGIELEGVSFRYPGTARDTLHDVDLRLPAGSVVALVGDNGAGKSTLVQVLLGLHPASGGRVLVDGVDLAQLDVDAWRRRVSAGFQDFARFELLARHTVGVGDLARRDDVAAVTAAVERAAAAEVVAGLPAGLDSQLGAGVPGGVELSGGQWQKLAVARAMMRPRPLLLVLDEPTAALDATSEHRLLRRYATEARRASARGSVTVLVSHRFSTVRMADLIVVLSDGRIAESGSHDQLMAAGGLYAEMYELQARHYR
jgi:ATP-binding cassette, subfamily B, bacterial